MFHIHNTQKGFVSDPVTRSVCLAVLLPAASNVLAQSNTTSGASRPIEEVVVTANRREQNLQQVGISAASFGGDQIESSGITETSDLGLITTGLIVSEAGGSELSGNVTIRGVSQNDFTGQIESPNAFYIDNFYQPAASSAVQQLFDLKRIEVLKGPQGTLFGRNATGGLLNVITNDPTDELSGYLQASIGTRDNVNLTGAISGPLSETTTGRVALYRNTHEPYYENITETGPDLNGDDTVAVRGKIFVEPNSDLIVKLGADYYRADYRGTGGAWIVPAALDPDTGLGFNLPLDTPFALAPEFVQTGGPFETSASVPGGYFREAYGVTADVSYDFGNVSLQSLTNYSTVETDYQEDNDQTPFDIGTFAQDSDSDHFTQELRLSSEGDRIIWSAGVYFLYIDGTYGNRFNFIAADADLSTIYTIETQSYSAFGQLTYNMSDALSITVGGRVVYDTRDYNYTFSCLGAPEAGCAGFGGPGTIGEAARANPGGLDESANETGWTGRVQLDYTPNEKTLLYASVNRGYKGFNFNANFAGNVPLEGLILDGEKLLAYEVGGKFDLLDGLATFNVAAYFYDYEDYHAFDQRGLNFTLFNADSEVSGMEADLVLTPGDGWRISMGVNYIFLADVFGVPIADQFLTRRAAQTPDFTGNVMIQKIFDTPAGEIVAQGAMAFSDDYFSYLSNAPNTLLPSYENYNFRVNFEPAAIEGVTFAAYCTNCLNNRKPNYAFDLAVAGYTELNFANPRIYGIEARMEF
ncbi:MAG: TonB-dependent receptor [Pseudomonadota bacterium]